jgi:hypothetical protein
LPDWVDPDRWLWYIKGKRFVRKVRANGSITIDKVPYYISKSLTGQYVVVWVGATLDHGNIGNSEQMRKSSG